MQESFNKLLFLLLLFNLLIKFLYAEPENQKPIPLSAHEIGSSLGEDFNQELPAETDLDDILNSSEIKLRLRNYYFNRGIPNSLDSYAWAQGAILSHKIGRVGGIFSMNTEFMTSLPIVAPDDHGGTGLLDKYQNEITKLGVLNPRLNFSGQVVSAYRQRYNMPYFNEQDSRIIPHTFEGYTIAQPNTTSKNFQYVAGYITKMKRRDSNQFEAISNIAGVTEKDTGAYFLGARQFITPKWSFSAIDYHIDDVLNILYADSVYQYKINSDIEHSFSVQYSRQSSVGDDLLTGQDFSTGFWGMQSITSLMGLVLKLSGNFNSEDADIKSPYGAYPGYNSGIVRDFNRAGQNSWQIGLSYDLARINLDGFQIATSYTKGNAAIDENTKVALPDESETDVTIDYRFNDSILKGLWLRLRSASINDPGIGHTQDFRIIVNYDFIILSKDQPDWFS
jgi:hypothetical protein